MIKDFINRIRRKGLKESAVSAFYRFYRPINKKRVRRKYSNYKGISTKHEFYSLLRRSPEIKPLIDMVTKDRIDEADDMFIRYLRDRRHPRYFWSREEAAELKEFHLKNNVNEAAATLEKAALICEHKLGWITPNCPDFNGSIDWKANFTDGKRWEDKFYTEVDYSGEGRPGDIRELWELNRHQFLITLGKAYFITGNERYAEEFVNEITEWIKENPCPYGINWLHSQETAIRMVSWIWAFHFFSDSPRFTNDKKLLLLQSMYEHAEFTYWHLSRRPVTHNHLITEICGLAVFCIMFPEFRKSRLWLRACIRIFNREVNKQIWEEGASGELASNYHCFVLESFLQLVILLKKNTYEIMPLTVGRIEKMVEFTMHLMRPDGSIPKLGDNDSGRAFKLRETDDDDRRFYLSIGAVLFGRGDFKYVSRKFYEEAMWMLGLDGLKKYNELNAYEPLECSKLFPKAGIAVYRDAWHEGREFFLFRGGPGEQRRGVSTSHNHSDFLSFEYYYKGIVFFIDPGTYLYSGPDKWRYLLRRSMGHNTVSIDGLDQLDVTSSRFGVGKLPSVTIHNYKNEALYDYIDMSHNGYDSFGITHRRRVVIAKGKYFLIVDELQGSGRHIINRHFNLDKSEVFTDTYKIKACAAGKQIDIYSLGNIAQVIHKVKGEDTGWVSYRYGEKHPATIVNIENETDLPCTVCTLIIPGAGGTPFSANFTEGVLSYNLILTMDDHSDVIVLSKNGECKLERTMGEKQL